MTVIVPSICAQDLQQGAPTPQSVAGQIDHLFDEKFKLHQQYPQQNGYIGNTLPAGTHLGPQQPPFVNLKLGNDGPPNP